jgi:class 3 adenylate cyclase/pSer/pThr/pTyr-binding forkhead associated (FHA) protein
VHGDHCVIADLGGRNGTFVNGQPITEAEVSDGDTVVLGRVSVQVAGGQFPPVTLSARHTLVPVSETVIFASEDPLLETQRGASGIDSSRVVAALRRTADALIGWRPFAEVLERLVMLMFEVVPAERAVLLLPAGDGGALAPVVARTRTGESMPRTTINRDIVERVHLERVAIGAHDASEELPGSDAPTSADLVRSFLCVPLLRGGAVLAVMYVDSSERAALTREDLRLSQLIAGYAAAALERAQMADRVAAADRTRDALERCHSPAVVERMLATAGVPTSGIEFREITVVRAEITAIDSDTVIAAHKLAERLNRFHDLASAAVFAERGTLDVVTALGVRAVFGAVSHEADHAQQAIRAALALRQALVSDAPDDALTLRLAVASGPAMVGIVGARRRLEFHAFGEAIELCARLLDAAPPGGTILSSTARDRVADVIADQPWEPLKVPGTGDSVDAFVLR